ncbi:hypothetical protein LCGC14_1805100 [marine sediment metagenome]|uniref:Uncharacterized protein n=1 Tax=marine sediment metagenome TaxID=412755 RepID=A0A0F9GNK2_9ZZZZ
MSKKLDDIKRLPIDIDPTNNTLLKSFNFLNDEKYACLYNINKEEPYCNHIFKESELINWLNNKKQKNNLCPECFNGKTSKIENSLIQGDLTPAKIQQLFSIFNLRPDPLKGHDPIPEIDGPPPILKEGFMMWKPKSTDPYPNRIGWIPMHVNKERLKFSEYHGLTIEEMNKKKLVQRTSTFKISYIIAYPSTRFNKNLDDLPLIGMLHGVPGNARWKMRMLRELGKFAVVVAWHMLGMGDSDQVLDYTLDENNQNEKENEAWDWIHDVPYVHQLMTEHIPDLLGILKFKIDPKTKKEIPRRWIFQSDDWGSGIHLRYLEQHNDSILHNFFVNPIWLDGYPVIEISTIGRLAAVRKENPSSFYSAAFGLPQIIIGIEKYMVEKRWKMNRYTETNYIYPYQHVDYQSGEIAADMPPNYWNIAVLANRSSRLAARQSQPYHPTENKYGFKPEKITKPIDFIIGLKVRVFDFCFQTINHNKC